MIPLDNLKGKSSGSQSDKTTSAPSCSDSAPMSSGANKWMHGDHFFFAVILQSFAAPNVLGEGALSFWVIYNGGMANSVYSPICISGISGSRSPEQFPESVAACKNVLDRETSCVDSDFRKNFWGRSYGIPVPSVSTLHICKRRKKHQKKKTIFPFIGIALNETLTLCNLAWSENTKINSFGVWMTSTKHKLVAQASAKSTL